MANSEIIVIQAWRRAGGYCECKTKDHDHGFARCGKQLAWGNKGKPGIEGWEPYLLSKSGGDELSNCEIRCRRCSVKF